MKKNLRALLALIILGILFLSSCELFISEDMGNGIDPLFDSMNFPIFENPVPEVAVYDGGYQSDPPGHGRVVYHNSTGLREESDIQLFKPINFYMTVKRYLEVAGLALPNDSGYTDRAYHTVIFTVSQGDYSKDFTFSVDDKGRFRGYLYFEKPGIFDVVAFRMWDNHLYPSEAVKSVAAVEQGAATLGFKVDVLEPVPSHLHYLLPSRGVDNQVTSVREYAKDLTSGLSTDLEKVKSIYEFLCFGDAKGAFEYSYYYEIAPGYLTSSWIDVFIASQFLEIRKGVCNDFSELFAALARAAGFDVMLVRGFSENESGHQWNKVKIDGIWYRLDATYGCGSADYKVYAEFYMEFNADNFYQAHEQYYYENQSEEY